MQKSVANEMDSLQAHMLSVLAKVPRLAGESVEQWFRKRQRSGRKLAEKCGLWSSIWIKRMLDWHEHVQRSEKYGFLGRALLEWHDQSWLTNLRLQWVSSDGSAYSRNRPDAGRLGSRLVGGQPQPRWSEGITLAN